MSRLETPRWKRLGVLIAALVAALALAVPAASSASTNWSAKLVIHNHRPRTCTAWHITVRATRGRKRLSGQVEYYYFTAADDNSGHLGANVPATAKSGNFSRGVFHDTLVLPSRYAAGVPLEFNAVVRTGYGVQTASAVIRPRASRRQCG